MRKKYEDIKDITVNLTQLGKLTYFGDQEFYEQPYKKRITTVTVISSTVKFYKVKYNVNCNLFSKINSLIDFPSFHKSI